MNPTCNGTSEIQHFERTDAIEIRDGIVFVFYPGLPHIYMLDIAYYFVYHTPISALGSSTYKCTHVRLHGCTYT